MSAFYGGRAECRIRHTEVPVALVDFTSMYPTLFALMNLWPYCVADQLDTVEATDEVRALLADLTVDSMFDPATWRRFVGIALVAPEADILPVRVPYNEHKDGLNIGVNYLTSSTPLWYTLADVAASTLLTGRPPKVLRAIRLTHSGRLPDLRPWTMPGGHVLDPTSEAPWPAMIEHRQRSRRDETLPPEVRERISLFLKITANAGGYGIYAEYNRQARPKDTGCEVDVYSHGDPFTARVTGPEDPGTFSCPPLAAVTTGGARLMLALLERCVTELGGSWAFADTDSMAIVATETGALVPCTGGPETDQHGQACVRALTFEQVEEIREMFTSLNPYDRAAVPDILKRELEANCFAVAAKRYALYRYDVAGQPRLVPAAEHQPCSHGLGHLLNPTDPDSDDRDWIAGWWERCLADRLTNKASVDPFWLQRTTLGKVASTSTATWKALRRINSGHPYRRQIKPFGFLLHAPGAGDGEQVGRLVAAFIRDPRRWDKIAWIDLGAPERQIHMSTDPTRPRRVTLDTYRSVANAYFLHPERKSCGPDDQPCGRNTTGLLGRRHVVTSSYSVIGKEANDLDQRTAGFKGTELTVTAVLTYKPAEVPLEDEALNRLRKVGATELARCTGLSERRIRDVLLKRAAPRRSTRTRLLAALESPRSARDRQQRRAEQPSLSSAGCACDVDVVADARVNAAVKPQLDDAPVAGMPWTTGDGLAQ